MLREYPCPNCGWTVNSWAQHRLCPRCDAPLPEHAVEIPTAQSQPAQSRDVDYFQRRQGPQLDEPDDEAPVPWLAHPAVLVALATFLALLLLGVAVWLVLDGDLDGMRSVDELRYGTSVWNPDSDGDRLGDGWELGRGTDPLRDDTDGDGLGDYGDILRGGSPVAADTDGDGESDAMEAVYPNLDCDGDGVTVLRSTDDDADGRPDALERLGERCRADSDADGVLDGSEGAAVCMHRPDCDGDGVPDGEERDPFDPLDPDSFDVGLLDAVSLAFERAGQPPSRDLDHDGIPDGWESSSGIVAWGDLQPQVGTTDLLVEFLRVTGPDSRRQATLDLAPALAAVQHLFAGNGITLRYVVTTIDLGTEPVFAPLPTSLDPLVSDMLNRSEHAGNPFVTTVLLTPQDDQAGHPHSGVAPIRGMLATVDFGTHVVFSFRDPEGTMFRLSPGLESLILAGQTEVLQTTGFDRGGVERTTGDVALRDDDAGYWLAWQPRWFRSVPRLELDNGTNVPLEREGVVVNHGALAATIAHELGHTLGLCHTHTPACQALLAPGEADRQASSVMSYDFGGALAFLPSEWERVGTYLTCPPAEALRLASVDARRSDLIAAKYAYTLETALSADVRECGSFEAVERTFAPERGRIAELDPRDLTPGLATPNHRSAWLLGGVLGGAAALAGLAGWLVAASRRPAPM